MSLISRGFGALQRIITRGFFSSDAPSPDCYVVFTSLITPDTSSPYVVLSSLIVGSISENGIIDDTETTGAGLLQPVIAFNSSICGGG